MNYNDDPPSSHVPLAPKVEELLRMICVDQNQKPPNPNVRRQLADMGEDGGLKLLNKIRDRPIRNLEAYIMYMIKQARTGGGSASPSPVKATYPTDHSIPTSCAIALSFNVQDGGSNSATTSPPQFGSENGIGNRVNPQLLALSKLEFRRQFLILSYIGNQRLEDVVTADLINELKEDRGMIEFEKKVWEAFGSTCIKIEDRCKYLAWDLGKAHIYHCHLSPDGNYRLKGPYFSPLRTLLQKKLGDDNVLLVKLAEEVNNKSGSKSFDTYKKIVKRGIYVGLRRFHFFVFKDGGKEEKKKDPTTSSVKCYYVCLEGNELLANKSVQEARSFFMHAHTVSSLSNYMIRLSLILSKTVSLEVDFNDVKVERIDDIECKDENGITLYDKKGKPLIHTDGTGYVSSDIAVKCSRSIYKGKCTSDLEIEPLLIQCRLFHEGLAVKGTLLVNKKLEKTIQVRPSMIKVEKDPNLANNPSVKSLEIVGTSNKPKNCHLSKNLILLLSFGGVPNEFFLDLLENALKDTRGVLSSKRSALKVAINHGDMDDRNAARMILSGIPLEESHLQYHLSILMKEEKKSLKGAKIPVPDSYYLMGTTDPTGRLKSDEVCIILDSGQISGTVLVYRNPGLRVGDIHVLKAKYVEELESYVGNSKFAIFFPCNGPRALPDEIAGGDLDGDMYWVSRNPQLLDFFMPSQPWKSASAPNNAVCVKPSDLSSDELEDQLIYLWLQARFNPSYTVGVAADSWMALMDRFLTIGDNQPEEKQLMEENMLKLIDLYYYALDQPKKGGEKIEVPSSLRADVFPHFMGKDESISYYSKSILGLIFDRVDSFQKQEKDQSKNVVIHKLPCFDVMIPEVTHLKWSKLYFEYRQEMRAALSNTGEGRSESLDEVIKKYKQELYGAADFEDSLRRTEDIMEEARAIYKVCYEYAEDKEDIGKCSFAWKIAGSALCKHYMDLHLQQGEKSITCAPSVLREIWS